MQNQKAMFEYILFDLDGTLTDPKEGITKCVQYALASVGIDEPDLDKLEPFIGPPLGDSFMEFYGFDRESAMKLVDKYRERFTDVGMYENNIYPGIAEMLETLKEAGCKISIASSKPTELVEGILDYFDIRKYFDCVVGSNMDGTRVKKEEVVEEALRQLQGVKEKTAMVGDRKFDIEGARAFGLISIGVSFGYAAENELEEAGADYIVDTVEELQNILLGDNVQNP